VKCRDTGQRPERPTLPKGTIPSESICTISGLPPVNQANSVATMMRHKRLQSLELKSKNIYIVEHHKIILFCGLIMQRTRIISDA